MQAVMNGLDGMCYEPVLAPLLHARGWTLLGYDLARVTSNHKGRPFSFLTFQFFLLPNSSSQLPPRLARPITPWIPDREAFFVPSVDACDTR